MESIPSENQRFKLWLEGQHRSASAVAKDLGVSRAVLSHILNGRNRLSLSVVQSAARAFDDFDLEYVVMGRTSIGAVPASPPPAPPASPPKREAVGNYDELILVRDGKFRVLLPEEA
ncbi:MAG: helix-turn-helix domain-containing protein [Schleiferiaceae bacterium]